MCNVCVYGLIKREERGGGGCAQSKYAYEMELKGGSYKSKLRLPLSFSPLFDCACPMCRKSHRLPVHKVTDSLACRARRLYVRMSKTRGGSGGGRGLKKGFISVSLPALCEGGPKIVPQNRLSSAPPEPPSFQW